MTFAVKEKPARSANRHGQHSGLTAMSDFITSPLSGGNPTMERALTLARYGYSIFPLQHNKLPYSNERIASILGIPAPPQGQGGSKLATRDANAIFCLWTVLPDALIGIATGAQSDGLIVLDIDMKDGKNGVATLAEKQWQLPPTAWQQTRSGGWHYLYRDLTGKHLPTDAGVLGEALDRRGDGGYVLDYGFDPSLKLASAPEWLLADGTPRHQGERRPLGDPALAAPSLAAAEMALNAHDPNDLSRDQWIAQTSAFKQATSSISDEAVQRSIWDGWCARYSNNDPSENDRQWKSIKSTNAGWPALRDKSPARAELIFGQRQVQQQSFDMQSPAQRTALEYLDGFAPDTAPTTSAAAMRKMHELGIRLAYNEFTSAVMLMENVAWDGGGNFPRPWTDNDIVGCKTLLESWFLKPSKETINDAAIFIAKLRSYHPVRDYLRSLEWDRVSRLETVFPRYFGSAANPYTQAIGKRFLVGAVARAMQPGCKFDTMLILEGAQGSGKSTALKILASEQWFGDQLPDLARNNDAMMYLAGKWIVEIAELSAFNRAESNQIKSFASSAIDSFRAPYARNVESHPRQSVLVGSTNEEGYLRDQTGNRRYWPIMCGKIDTAGIGRDRDQLWAEAYFRFNIGEAYFLNEDEQRFAAFEQEDRREQDAWEPRIMAFVANLNGASVTIEYIASAALFLATADQNTGTNKRIANCLRAIGYKKVRRSGSDGKRFYHYEQG